MLCAFLCLCICPLFDIQKIDLFTSKIIIILILLYLLLHINFASVPNSYLQLIYKL